jgi:uncharacterized protein YbaP (TraB family)
VTALRRLIIVFFFGLAWLAQAPAWAVERGALFKLTAYGHTLHLFGTMHVGVAAFYPLEPRITEAVASASALALELDPDPSTLTAVRALDTYGVLPPGAAGYGQLGAGKLAQLDELARASGLSPASAHHFKPVLLATMLSLSQYEKLGYRPELSTDRVLARLAREHSVRIVELESLGGQLAMLDRLPGPAQWNFLNECLDSIASGAQASEARTVVDAWGSADQAGLDALAQRLQADDSVGGKFTREVLIDGRNYTLADKIDALLKADDKVVAGIGVLHLLGQHGVPELLRERGVTVERVY